MAGINRYYLQRTKSSSQTLSEASVDELLRKSASELAPTKSCVFLSHKSEDKEDVKKIAEHIKSKNIDVYLDIDDENLQKAVRSNDHRAITKFIELGIRSSTDLLSVISEKTRYSWWVPYEIGYGKSSEKSVASMPLKDVSVPSFLKICRIVKGTKSLDDYLTEIRRREVSTANRLWELNETLENIKQAGSHPLAEILNVGV